LRLEDVLTRRTRIALETADGGRAAAPAVAQIMRRHLGWPAERVDAELDAYRAWLETERGEMLQ
jgi:glycerol-3-phosphate dehydrogenase